jgi:peptidoglycan/xylan/chitin deacetylase (PgdA/CDA1 family)
LSKSNPRSSAASGALPERAAAITFDDGYADNFTRALPLLREQGLPATFFVATGFLDGGRMWNDTISEAIRRCNEDVVDLSAIGLTPGDAPGGFVPAGTAKHGRT